MLSWNLTDTPLAKSDIVVRVPSEPELLAIMIAMLAVESLAYEELCHQELCLTEKNREAVANFLTTQLPVFRDVLGGKKDVRKWLAELTGISVVDA